MSLHPYVAIEGAIGVGKTTLARVLSETLPGESLLEVFEENPFLGDFYADRARYAFQTQIFFLLSRYRQQHRVIASTLKRNTLISDYLFAKDWLFAHLNLVGDELAMYERVHAILGEHIPAPSLVVYLRASTDTLMRRIAFRDRSYERQMERDYIEALRQTYDHFFSDYTAAPLLVLDTDNLDFVNDSNARAQVISRIKGALDSGSYQLPLLDLPNAPDVLTPIGAGFRLHDFQRLQEVSDREKNLIADLFFNYIAFTESIGNLGRTLKSAWRQQDQLLAQTGNRQEAHDRALGIVQPELEVGLAEALADLLKIANDAGIDLEVAYIRQARQHEPDALQQAKQGGQAWPNALSPSRATSALENQRSPVY